MDPFPYENVDEAQSEKGFNPKPTLRIVGIMSVFATAAVLLGKQYPITQVQVTDLESIEDSVEDLWSRNSCSDYEDDTIYTNASCSTPDKRASSLHCPAGGWCDVVCGDDCAAGSCAVCSMLALSNMTALCDNVHSIRMGSTELITAPPSEPLEEVELSKTERRVAFGCDAHSWCDFCGHECAKVVHWEKQYYGSHIGTGPASMEALNKIEHWCVAWRKTERNVTV